MQQHKTKKVSIGIDLMGNENAPEDLAKILLELDKPDKEKGVRLFLLGTKETFSSFKENENVSFIICEEVIEMEDSPLYAIRRKKESSMHKGIHLLAEKKIDAFISLGSTGALVGLSTLKLPLLPKITRPALLATLPSHKNPLVVLDVGAHIDCKIENFLEFAHLGNAYQKIKGVKKPRIGLLNIGSEKLKGTTQVKKVFELLEGEKDHLHFIGNIEGKEIFQGDIDVVLSDGFSGNIFLKTAEGIASLILDKLGQNNSEENKSFLLDVKKRLHYAQYPGAVLIGLDALVIKCHSSSNPKSLINALSAVKEMVETNFLKQLKKAL